MVAQDIVLQITAAGTGGLSFISGLSLALISWTARGAAVQGSHPDNILLLLCTLGAFDALYGASFLIDAGAVYVDGRSSETYSVFKYSATPQCHQFPLYA